MTKKELLEANNKMLQAICENLGIKEEEVQVKSIGGGGIKDPNAGQ